MKKNMFLDTENLIKSCGFSIVSKDFKRPWGGFLVIDENQAQEFSNIFFKGLDVNTLKIGGKLSPKILIVKPNSRLSWHYHNRRAEIWQIFKGSAGIIRSDSDIEIYKEGDQNNNTIPERLICDQMGISLIDGLGDKIQSSSWLLKK